MRKSFRKYFLAVLPFAVLVCGLAQSRSDEESGEISIFLPKNPKYAARMLKIQPNARLVRIKRSEPVYIALLGRHGIDMKYRREALEGLARLRKTDAVTELLAATAYIDQFGVTKDPDDDSLAEPTEAHLAAVAAELTELASSFTARQWAAQRGQVEKLVTSLKQAPLRTLAFTALIAADGSAEHAWEVTGNDKLPDLLRGIAAIKSADVRATLYAKILPILTGDAGDETKTAAIGAIVHVPGHDTEIFAALTALVKKGKQRDAAIAALRSMGKSRWPKGELRPVAEAIVSYVEELPAEQRTSATGEAAFALGHELAELLPATEGQKIRSALNGLGVRVINIATVHEEMRYDKDVLVAQAGETLQIVLKNDDAMPHNLVVTAPGALEEIGVASELSSTDPEAAKRDYIPVSDKVLYATKMVQPREEQKLTFTVPATAGVYAIVCTFPGHWRKMYGALVVTEDVKTYLAANDPLPTADMLLGIVKRNWKIDELLPELNHLAAGRAFANGEKLFTKSSCFSCHSMRGKGGRIGPELAEIHKKYKPYELLREIMQPSLKVEPKFARVEVYDDATGKSYQGVIVKETDEQIHLMENPLATCEPMVIDKSPDIEITPSKVSPMPEGLLSTITELDDVLDLLAYVISGGDASHAAFKKN